MLRRLVTQVMNALGWWEYVEVFVPTRYPLLGDLTGYSTPHLIPYDPDRGVTIPRVWHGYPTRHVWRRAKPTGKGGA